MVTENMGLTVPTASLTTGPDYAEQISEDLEILDGHGHTGAPDDGVQIVAAALNINSDVSWQSNDITSLRSARFTEQSAVLASGGDTGCIYDKSGDLYWNNGSGTAVQVTSGAGLATTAQNLSWSRLAVSGDITILNTDQYVLYDVSTAAARQITLPTASSVGAGRRYVICDASGTGADSNAITIVRAGADTIDGATSFVLRSKRGKTVIWSDGTSTWHAFTVFNYDVGNQKVSHLTVLSTDEISLTAANGITIAASADNLELTTGSSATLDANTNVAVTATTGSVTVAATAGDVIVSAGDDLTLAGAGDAAVTATAGTASVEASAGEAKLQGTTATNIVVGGTASAKIKTNGGTNTVIEATDNKLGFYNTAAVAKQTGVAVSDAAIHAALVNLGLIGA